MLHYNFPPFSTGETKPMRGPGRREIGHGALAERALARHAARARGVPVHDPHRVRDARVERLVARWPAVCGGSLSLMDAGVPIKAPVAGIAMGLITEDGKVAILSDILGDEDHLGDMDFKVCGTAKGITAIQMDIKIEGSRARVLEQALEQARAGRLHILGKMPETLQRPRAELNRCAPRITTVKVKPDQIRIIIGPGGKTIKGIIDQTGCSIDVEGRRHRRRRQRRFGRRRSAPSRSSKACTAEPEVGAIYKGTSSASSTSARSSRSCRTPRRCLHVSEIAHERVENAGRRPQGGRRGRGEGDQRRARRQDPPHPPRAAARSPRATEGERAKERIARAREQGGGPPRGGGGRGGDRDRGGRGGDRDRGPRRDRR